MKIASTQLSQIENCKVENFKTQNTRPRKNDKTTIVNLLVSRENRM